MTARTLETMIRLATAHSKLRFSRKIEKQDVEVAQQLMLRIIDQSRTVEGEPDGADGDEGAALEDDDGGAPMEVDAPAARAPAKATGSRCALLSSSFAMKRSFYVVGWTAYGGACRTCAATPRLPSVVFVCNACKSIANGVPN